MDCEKSRLIFFQSKVLDIENLHHFSASAWFQLSHKTGPLCASAAVLVQ